MTDNEVDTLSEELLIEFTRLGKDYPYLTKMIMDMVSIMSQQNSQLEAITNHLEALTTEINKQHFVLEDVLRDWQRDGSSLEISELGSKQHLDYLAAFSKPGKDELN